MYKKRLKYAKNLFTFYKRCAIIGETIYVTRVWDKKSSKR